MTPEHPTRVADCRRCESPLERGDLRCAICGEIAPAALAEDTPLQVQILRCQGCAAAMRYDEEVGRPKCGFCGEALDLEELHDPVEQTDRHLPFSVDASSAQQALRRWQGSLGWFRPSDLRSASQVASLRPLYWVAWVFDAEALVSWTADSDAGSRRSSWAPHAGQVGMVFDDMMVSASRGLSDDETWHLAPSYDLATRVAGEPEAAEIGLPELLIERFDLQRSQARQRVLQGIDRLAKARVEREHIPGSTFRKVHCTALLRRLDTRRAALPAWVMAYRYKGELYRVVVSGQDAACITGEAPYSWLKILGTVLLGLVVLAVILAALLR